MILHRTCAVKGSTEKLPVKKCVVEPKRLGASITGPFMTKTNNSVVMGPFIIKRSLTSYAAEDMFTTADIQQLAAMAYYMTGDANFAAKIKLYTIILGDITGMENAAVRKSKRVFYFTVNFV